MTRIGLLTLIVFCPLVGSVGTAQSDDKTSDLRTFVGKYCVDCHSHETRKGNLDFEATSYELTDPDAHVQWTSIYDRIDKHEMPPKPEIQPTAAERQLVLDRLRHELEEADPSKRRRIIRRLNRTEYENSVCDLFKIRANFADMLPIDGSGIGFDTNAESLNISAEHMEAYLQAAEQIVARTFGPERAPTRTSVKMRLANDADVAKQIGKNYIKTDDGSVVTFWSSYPELQFHSGASRAEGTYRVRIQAKVYQSKKPLVMAVYGGTYGGGGTHHLVGYFDVPAGDEWTTVEIEDYLTAGGFYRMVPYRLLKPLKVADNFKGPGLMVGDVSVEGPLETWPPVSRAELLGKIDPKTATASDVKEVFKKLLPRVFRRQVDPREIDLFTQLVIAQIGDKRGFRDSLALGIKAILCSPDFLFREEPIVEGSPDGRITDLAVASRISYFLWSSTPDDELLAVALDGRLSDPEIVRGQVERMLADPKSRRFVESFTGQWLGLQTIDATEPDSKLYPEYDEMLRFAMIEETRRCFREILDHDLPVHEFINSDWSILNERLGIHYGIRGIFGQEYRRVSLPVDSVRGGVLTQASVLKTLANGTSTSPVIRGAWVLKSIVGQPSPPPPADVPSIDPDLRGASTIVEQLEKHRKSEACAVCHRRIDPPGLALENFDPIGGWRQNYRSLTVGAPAALEINGRRVQFRVGRPVNARRTGSSGDLTDIRQLKKELVKDRSAFAQCLAEKLLAYAIGRDIGFSDRPAIEAIVANIEQKNYGFRSLIHEVIQSPAFWRR